MVIRNRPDVVACWSDREVAIRWLRVFPGRRFDNQLAEPTEADVNVLVGSPDKLKTKKRKDRHSMLHLFKSEKMSNDELHKLVNRTFAESDAEKYESLMKATPDLYGDGSVEHFSYKLIAAVDQNSPDLIDALVRLGADVNANDPICDSCLGGSCKIEAAKRLLELGAKINHEVNGEICCHTLALAIGSASSGSAMHLQLWEAVVQLRQRRICYAKTITFGGVSPPRSCNSTLYAKMRPQGLP